MFGGNGDESKQIINLGKKIIREYSGQEAKDRLEFNEMMDEFYNNFYNNTENRDDVKDFPDEKD